MLTLEQNERLTQVGPGTPMGELMRRYWHPFAAVSELEQGRPTKEVRLLGEDLVLYKDLGGRYGLLSKRCAHRSVNLFYGYPQEEGLRCPYHGWLYDATGQCIEQPAEPPGSTFKDKIKIPAYPVQELGGVLFTYLGPEPVPLLPRWDILVWDNVYRSIVVTVLPCNWLQCMENSYDPTHNEWLHGKFGLWVKAQLGMPADHLRLNAQHHARMAFDRTPYGIVKRRMYAGDTEEDVNWRIGNAVVIPNILRQGGRHNLGEAHGFQYRVPIDDTHTLHLRYTVQLANEGDIVPPDAEVEFKREALYGDDGYLLSEQILEQDHLAWVSQGPTSDRSLESLGQADAGLILFRQILEEQIRVVEDKGDPLNVFRNPEENICYTLPQTGARYPGESEPGGPFSHLRPPASSTVDVVLT